MILTSILPLFLLIALGVLVQKTAPVQPSSSQLMCKLGLGSCDTMVNVLNRFALHLALPALVIHSLITVEDHTNLPLPVLAHATISLLVMIALLVIVTKLFRLDTETKNTYIMCGFFGNIAYIGPPFLASLLPGNESLVSLLIAIHVGVAFTVGIAILEYSKHHRLNIVQLSKTLATNPLILSTALGILLFFLPVALPDIVVRAIGLLAASASPVVLIAIGAFMASEWHPDGTISHSVIISLLALVGMPALFLLTSRAVPSSEAMTVSILEAAMPVALTNFALAEQYPLRKKIIANAIIFSTTLSLLTIAGWSVILL